jgi:putative membrane protein
MVPLLAVVSLDGVLASLIYSGIGLAVFVVGFYVIKLILPFDVNKEIEADQNTALGIVIGSFIIGLAIIVAAAISGSPAAPP